MPILIVSCCITLRDYFLPMSAHNGSSPQKRTKTVIYRTMTRTNNNVVQEWSTQKPQKTLQFATNVLSTCGQLLALHLEDETINYHDRQTHVHTAGDICAILHNDSQKRCAKIARSVKILLR